TSKSCPIPQTCWSRGVLSLQMGGNLLNDRRVCVAGERLPRELSECFGHRFHRATAFTASLEPQQRVAHAG
ncbi:MAG: hypothetical protein ABF290_15890, partial [Thiogranum sp.]